MAISQYDIEGLYMAKQTAKGTPNTVLKSAMLYQSLNNTVDKAMVEIGPGLGQTFYKQKAFNGSFIGNTTVEGVLNISRLLNNLLSPFCALTTDAVATPVYAYTWLPLASNSVMPWFTTAVVYGKSGTLGSGIKTKVMRDSRITTVSISIASGEAPTFSQGFSNLNEGVGAGTETFSHDSSTHIPIPSYAASNIYTMPSWWPATFCMQSFKMEWSNAATNAGPCLNSGEFGDILTTQAGWTFTFQVMYDANTNQIYNHAVYGTNTSISAYDALQPGFKEGAFDFTIATQEVIPSTIVPYSFSGAFPDLQWTVSNITSGQTPVMLEITAMSFGANWSFTGNGDKTNAQMSLG